MKTYSSQKKTLIGVCIVVCIIALGFYSHIKLKKYFLPPTTTIAIDTVTKNTISLLDKVPTLDSASDRYELVSPDGEWYFAGERYFGREPFSRNLSWYLEFINLKGNGNRYIYEDWFERPEDGDYDSSIDPKHPIGWSADGNAIYMAQVKPLSYDIQSLPVALNGYWSNPTNVVRINLEVKNPGSNHPYSQNVRPNIEEGGQGHILDLLGKEDRALWFESLGSDKLSPARLIYFRPSDNEGGRVIATWHDSHSVSSATLDRDLDNERVAYITHQPGKNDRAYVYESTSSTTSTVLLDLTPYRNKILKNGIREPYQLLVEKTAINLPNGLFLVVIGSNKKIMYIRFNYFKQKWEPIIFSKNGLI